MSVQMRHTSSHTKNRRSHHALKEPRLSKCAECSALHLRHHVCQKCGMYRGRKVIDMEAVAAREATRLKKKRLERGLEPEKEGEESASEKPLSPIALSERPKKKK